MSKTMQFYRKHFPPVRRDGSEVTEEEQWEVLMVISRYFDKHGKMPTKKQFWLAFDLRDY